MGKLWAIAFCCGLLVVCTLLSQPTIAGAQTSGAAVTPGTGHGDSPTAADSESRWRPRPCPKPPPPTEPIPEPGTFALMGLGTAAFLGRVLAKRRKSRS